MLRKIRRVVVVAAMLAAPTVIATAQPANAVWCGPDENNCDCSVYVLKKEVIHCDN